MSSCSTSRRLALPTTDTASSPRRRAQPPRRAAPRYMGRRPSTSPAPGHHRMICLHRALPAPRGRPVPSPTVSTGSQAPTFVHALDACLTSLRAADRVYPCTAGAPSCSHDTASFRPPGTSRVSTRPALGPTNTCTHVHGPRAALPSHWCSGTPTPPRHDHHARHGQIPPWISCVLATEDQ